jgi:hypothetical protein
MKNEMDRACNTYGTDKPLRQVTGWTARLRFLAGASDFSLLHSVQTGSGAYPTSYAIDTMVSLPGSKVARI